MKRPLAYATTLLLLAACHSKPLESSQPEPAKGPPNIVFIYSDDHATAAIGTYANSVVSSYARTPNIDALAAGGMRFDRAYCTNGICAPARAVVLTGKHSHINGVPDNGARFDGSQVTFPKLLRASGYQTALVGKWHLKTTPTGFDYWDILPGQGQYYAPDFLRPGPNYVEGAEDVEGSVEKRRVEGYVTEVTTGLAIDWLEQERDPDKPFLLMVQHKAPHRPWMPGVDEHGLYAGETLPEPTTLFDDYAGRADGAQTQEMTIAEHMWLWYDLKVPPTEWGQGDGEVELTGPDRWTKGRGERMSDDQRAAWEAAYGSENAAFAAAIEAGELEGDELVRWKYQRYLKDYLSCIAAVDKSVGELTDWLAANDLDENTIVVYSSDQGFYLGEHGWYDKRWMYEPSFQLPLIVSWPGKVKAGSVDRHLVQNLDFAPTFLEAAGLASPEEMQGTSLMPLLAGDDLAPGEWRDSIYYRYFEIGVHSVPQHYGVRTDRHKLIYYHGLNQWELFDIELDADEMNNLYADPAYAEVRVTLEAELQRLRTHYADAD
ncbi:MAG: arylsulfatase A-like enzyme [Planctomycetota bacterium]|jgi:arylsulfatase A-like enzyme